VSQQKGFVKYIDKKEIKKDVSSYKVITTRASFGANSGFGNIFIGNPGEVHTGSYISFKVSNETEAKSLLSYMKCRLPNLLLSLRKISQDISESTCKWIPLPPLNIEWNDEEIYKYFELSGDEIKLIKETKINGYNDIKCTNESERTDESEYKIVKDGRKQYYLIDNKLYKIKKNKLQGDLFGSYDNGKIVEDMTHVKLCSNKKRTISKISKKKSIQKPIIIIDTDDTIDDSTIATTDDAM
jgi:hypothetical protein